MPFSSFAWGAITFAMYQCMSVMPGRSTFDLQQNNRNPLLLSRNLKDGCRLLPLSFQQVLEPSVEVSTYTEKVGFQLKVLICRLQDSLQSSFALISLNRNPHPLPLLLIIRMNLIQQLFRTICLFRASVYFPNHLISLHSIRPAQLEEVFSEGKG